MALALLDSAMRADVVVPRLGVWCPGGASPKYGIARSSGWGAIGRQRPTEWGWPPWNLSLCVDVI